MQMKNFKEDFPLLRENPVVYLDSAATAQRPESVINSEMEFYKKFNACRQIWQSLRGWG